MNQMISVLVVDDDPALRAMLTDVLTLEGYRVQTAEHGGPALDIMRATSAHLLVTLGLVMPEVNGRDVLEAVASDDDLPQRQACLSCHLPRSRCHTASMITPDASSGCRYFRPDASAHDRISAVLPPHSP